MSRTSVIRLPTGTADLAVLQDTHARIEEAARLGLISFEGGTRDDLHNGAPFDLLAREDRKLNTNHRFYIRPMLVKSGWHLINQ